MGTPFVPVTHEIEERIEFSRDEALIFTTKCRSFDAAVRCCVRLASSISGVAANAAAFFPLTPSVAFRVRLRKMNV